MSVLKDHSLAMFRHPENRLSVYDEAKACMELGKGDMDVILGQLQHYAARGFPGDPSPATGVIFRRHNDRDVIRAMEDWWRQVRLFSHRDQLSLGYVAWRNKLKCHVIDDNIRDNEYFTWRGHSVVRPPGSKSDSVSS